MSPTTWGPSADSHFKFFLDGQLRATIGNNERALVEGLPTDRAIRVRVTLDAKPFESFPLSLGKEPDQRVCLHLYSGYWHWIDTGWAKVYGCECAVAGPAPELGRTPTPPHAP
ncbi:MAG TPA: hypothetical protein PK413_11160 [Thermoanaerobaculia bacterium]|nr:hypothetical protein [Thermoanaerobaculia bacterium]